MEVEKEKSNNSSHRAGFSHAMRNELIVTRFLSATVC